MKRLGDNDDVEGVPKLPRGRSFKWTFPMLTRIGMTAALLVLLLVVRKPCSDSVGKLVTDFGSAGSGSAGSKMPKPGNVDLPVPQSGSGSGSGFVVLHPDMTQAEWNQLRGSGSGSGSQ